MFARTISTRLARSLTEFPVVALVGSRQVGKTTLARRIARERGDAILLDLERDSDLAKLSEPELYLSAHADRMVVIDEIQRMPSLFPLLRALVDEARRPGRFLILGSASPSLLRQSSESLAGRIETHELPPLTIAEAAPDPASRERLWLRGGYPGSFLARDGEASLRWREAFLATFAERDLALLGSRIPSPAMRRFLTVVAHYHGRLWNASEAARTLDASPQTAARHLDLLGEGFLVHRLPPELPNVKKRLVKSPKIYFRDPGLFHALLGIGDFETLAANPALGPSWEGLVVHEMLAALPPGWRASFYRTAAGAEIDLVLVPPRGAPVAVEAKRTATPSLSRGFRAGFADLACARGFVVHPGSERYPLDRAVDALPLEQAARIFAA